MEKLNKGLYEQMQDSKTNLECYNNLTLDMLTEFATQIASKVTDKNRTVYPELTEEQVKEYLKFIKKIKSGYLYQIKGNSAPLLEERNLIITTGSNGCKDFIRSCIKDSIPPSWIIPNIWVIDDERNVMFKLIDIKWAKINKLNKE